MGRNPFINAVSRYERYREKTLNLIPSENVLSPEVLRALGSGMAGRYAGTPESYAGTAPFHELWRKCESLAGRIFSAKCASVIPISGHIAGMMALDQFCHKGDTIATLAAEDGGYRGYNQNYIPDLLGLKVVYLPFDRSTFSIDIRRSLALIKVGRPSAVIFGATVFLFPHPVKEISEEVHSYGGKVIYDGSHVLGLIAGGEFQRPFQEGADMIIGSTHKTLFGPQGGIIVSNDHDILKGIEKSYLYRFIDNFHLNRIAALGIALEEIKLHGRQYARNVVKNSRMLAAELDTAGLPVAGKDNGFTRSHQVFLDYYGEGTRARDVLESNNIVVDSRVRLGTNEVTRRGMETSEMKEVARLVVRGLEKRNNQAVRKDVFKLVRRFRRIKYTLRN